MSKDRSCPGGSGKYDAILTRVIDREKVDLDAIESQIIDILKQKSPSHYQLITDLIMEYLRSERYPDAKVIQCELSDYGFLSLSGTRRLMRRLWDLLLHQQDYSYHKHSSKYQKISSSKRVQID